MVQEFSGSAPVAGTVSASERQDAHADLPGTQEAAQILGKEDTVVPADDGLVAFVAAEEFANSKWLVKAGTVVEAPPQVGGTIGIIPAVTRKGDIWVKFVNSVFVTDNPDAIQWCEENSTICRPESDPATKAWATLKSLQTRRANRERLLDPTEMDADQSFPVGSGKSALQEQVASPDSVGGKAVESARISRESIQQEQAVSN